MNQILNTKKNNKKIKKLFKIQFGFSIIFIILGISYIFKNLKEKEKENNISNIISLNAKINTVFSSKEEESIKNQEQNIYFGRIICEKIGLDYYIYNEYSEKNLKILPCKFSGPNSLEENGNICIIGHNYYDDRFFSNLNKLENKDIVILKNSEEKVYKYIVYRKYEIDEEETENVVNTRLDRELTLCTCTFDKSKRLVIRAKFVQN